MSPPTSKVQDKKAIIFTIFLQKKEILGSEPVSELPVHPSSPVRKWPVAHLQQCSGVNHLQAYCVAIGLGTK